MLSDLFVLCARNLHSTMIALFGPVILASHRIDPIFKVNVWNTFDGNGGDTVPKNLLFNHLPVLSIDISI